VEYIFALAVGGIAGTGTRIMPVPVLVYAFNPKDAAACQPGISRT
jgi:hypothetical protein